MAININGLTVGDHVWLARINREIFGTDFTVGPGELTPYNTDDRSPQVNDIIIIRNSGIIYFGYIYELDSSFSVRTVFTTDVTWYINLHEEVDTGEIQFDYDDVLNYPETGIMVGDNVILNIPNKGTFHGIISQSDDGNRQGVINCNFFG